MAEKERQGAHGARTEKASQGTEEGATGTEEEKSPDSSSSALALYDLSLQGSSPSTLVYRGNTYTHCHKAR